MSDDTPTQRYPEGFPPPHDPRNEPAQPAEPTQPFEPAPSPLADAPTERFAAPGTVPPGVSVPPRATIPPAGTIPPAAGSASGGDDERRQRGLVTGLLIAAGVLLLALIGLLVWIAVNSGSPQVATSDTPTASKTPDETPTPTPTPTPSATEEPPPPPPPPADAISSFTTSTQQADCTASGGDPVPLTFSWAATGTRLWFGVGTDDAQADPFAEYPLNYTMNDVSYQCGQPGQQQRYTVTVERGDGTTESKTLIIREI